MCFGTLFREHCIIARPSGLYIRHALCTSLCLTKNPQVILDYLGIECTIEHFYNISTLQEFLECCWTTKYKTELRVLFDESTNRNFRLRKQMKKERPIPKGFITYVHQQIPECPPRDQTMEDEKDDYNRDRKKISILTNKKVERAINYFHKEKEFEKLKRIVHKKTQEELYVKMRCNGKHLTEWFNLKGPALGQFINIIKSTFPIELLRAPFDYKNIEQLNDWKQILEQLLSIK